MVQEVIIESGILWKRVFRRLEERIALSRRNGYIPIDQLVIKGFFRIAVVVRFAKITNCCPCCEHPKCLCPCNHSHTHSEEDDE